MFNRVLIVLIGLLCIWCNSRVDNSLIDNWKVYPIPTNADALRTYDHSQKEWTVFIKNNSVHVMKSLPYDDQSMLPFNIEPKRDSKRKISFLAVEDGYLIGFYRGEWGGDLYWFSKDGKLHYLISDDEIIQFIKRNSKIYAIQGLNHLGSSKGTIINVEKKNGKWIAKEYLKLPQAPYCFGLDSKNNFIILTSNSLLKVDTSKNIKTLVDVGIWQNRLYPNSLVIINNNVFAGMRAGVYKYSLSNTEQKWLLPY